MTRLHSVKANAKERKGLKKQVKLQVSRKFFAFAFCCELALRFLAFNCQTDSVNYPICDIRPGPISIFHSKCQDLAKFHFF